MDRLAATILATALIALVWLPAASAGHNPTQTTRCTYELGPGGDTWELTRQDPVGVTADGTLNWAGCLWAFRETTDPVFNTVFDPPQVDGEYNLLQLSIVDDIWGTQIGGRACGSIDDDAVCGQESKGETAFSFCGTSPVMESHLDVDGDGHSDFGYWLVMTVNGPITQAMFCDPTANPVGATSGGILNTDGGVFMMLGG